MGKNNQNDFQVGTPGYSVKYFKREILKALIVDLGQCTDDGIPENVCKQVYAALNTSVTIAEDLDIGTFLTSDLSSSLAEFRNTYKDWNGVKVPKGREVLHGELIKKRRKILKGWNKTMKAKKKADPNEWEHQLTFLTDSDKNVIDELSYTFSELVKDHGETIFTDLAKSYRNFKKLNEQTGQK